MKRAIYFDIDHTLFDSSKLGLLFYQELSKQLDLSVEEIIKIQNEYRTTLKSHTDFYPEDFFKYIYKSLGKNYSNFINPIDKAELYQKSIFEETIEVLKVLKNTYRLGIFSEGYTDYQNRKMKYSGIIDYLDKDLIIISRRKLNEEDIKKIETGSIVIDDDKEVVKQLKNYGHFETVWLNRKNDQEMIENVAMIKSLDEL